jgi:hypothetical protein
LLGLRRELFLSREAYAIFVVLPFFCSTRAASASSGSHVSIAWRQGASDQVVGRAMIRGEPGIGRDQSREPRLYSVEPVRGAETMKQSYDSVGKAPRRGVHSLSGIAAIAGFGLPPPRIVIGYPAHQAQDNVVNCELHADYGPNLYAIPNSKECSISGN